MKPTYAYAAEATGMADMARARVRVFGPCPSVSNWAPIALGTDQKHGQPRRTKESP